MSAWLLGAAGVMTRVLLALTASLASVTAGLPAHSVADARVLVPYGAVSPVGALFTLTRAGRLGHHFCTASVVSSAAGDLLLTAAHCVRGRPAGRLAFVPGDLAPRGRDGAWRVSAVLVDRRWREHADPDDDFAFLIVRSRGHRARLESLTGAEAVAVGVPAGLQVEVAGYPDDASAPVRCATAARALSATQFTFQCTGFADGTSGGPLLADIRPAAGLDTVIGVIGGHDLGGRTASVSYAARFG